MQEPENASCKNCGRAYGRGSAGVWSFLTAERLAYFKPFLDSYTRIRRAEGRGAGESGYYLRLPDCSKTDPLYSQWRIRKRSMTALRRLLREQLPIESKIADLGAGVGWLSHRLHEAGYLPCAVDLSIDEYDGLAAASHFQETWPRVQAEFDRLPFAADDLDCVIFNASLHYSEDSGESLTEALRILRPGGLLIIMDSPIYRDGTSGKAMVAEQHENFTARFGDRSNHLASIGFLTWAGVRALGQQLGISFSVCRPWYGLRWFLRPAIASLRRTREPATFALLWARKPGESASSVAR
jgi:SAM-dependent methyltransferase